MPTRTADVMSMGVLEIPNMPESRSEVVLLRRTSVATEAAAASVETMMPTPVARLTWRLIGALRASLTREMHRRVMTRLMRLWIVVEMIEIVRMASPLGAEAARIACRTMKAAVAKMAARPTARGSNDRIASRIRTGIVEMVFSWGWNAGDAPPRCSPGSRCSQRVS